jgi:hypothetical protein
MLRFMELDLEGQFADRAYPILASLVTPRPIALVTTLSPDGKVNAAPFSFFNVLGAAPPILAFAPGDRDDGTPKDTARNIRLTHEFVVNLVDEAIAEAMNKCAASLPYGENEPHSRVARQLGMPGMGDVADREQPRGDRPGETCSPARGIVRCGKEWVRSEKLFLIGRMASPHSYCRTRDRFEMIRPE